MSGAGGIDREHALIWLILTTKDLRHVLTHGVTPDLLVQPIRRAQFIEIVSYYKHQEHHGCIPSLEWMEERYPGTLPPIQVNATLAEVCRDIRERALCRQINDAVLEVCDLVDQFNGDGAFQLLRQRVAQWQHATPQGSVRVLSDDVENIIFEAEQRRNRDLVQGLPFPWRQLNQKTQGLQTEDFLVIFARPKSMKTWLAMELACSAYMDSQARVLIYSCEMPTNQLEQRVACSLATIDYTRFREGHSTPKEWEDFQTILRLIPQLENRLTSTGRSRALKFVSSADVPGGGGVSHLQAVAEEFEPDLIIVDALYRMLDDRTGKHDLKWTVQANIAQDLKGTTQQLHVPVIGVTQRSRTKKGGPEGDEHLEDISFADALGQEADMVWRVKKEGRDSDGVSTRLRVNIAGARELQVAGFLLSVRLCQHWHWKGWTDEEGRLLDESGQVVPEDPQLNPIRTGREVLEERKARGGGRRKPIQKTDHEDLQQHYGALVPEEPEDEPT